MMEVIVMVFGCFLTQVNCWEIWKSTCYFYGTRSYNYADSKFKCEQMYAHLVEVETMNEYNEVRSHMVAGKDYWTGAQRRSNNEYYWAIGGGLVLNDLWVSYAPDDYDKCARFMSNNNHRLNDKKCDNDFQYICEKVEDKDAQYVCVSGGAIGNNIAKNHETLQSSKYNYSSEASFAVDGNDVTCSITQVGTNVWWQVDLQNHFLINRVKITNRRDCCEGYFRDIEIRLYATNPVTYGEDAVFTTCSIFTGPATPGQTQLFISCNKNTTGRWFRIVKTSSSNSVESLLSLCEVEVYGVQCTKEAESSTCSLPNIKYNVTTTNDLTTNYQTTLIETTTLMNPTTSKDHTTQQYTTTTIETTTQLDQTTSEDYTTHHQIASFETTQLGSTSANDYSTTGSKTQTDISDKGTDASGESITTCLCPCVVVNNSTEEELFKSINKIVNELKVKTKSTKSYTRTLISTGDNRPLSKGFGCLGITVLMIILLFFVASDMLTFLSFVYSKYKDTIN